MRPHIPSDYFICVTVTPLPFSKLVEVYHASVLLAGKLNLPVRFQYGSTEYTALPTSVCGADCPLCSDRNPKLVEARPRPETVDQASKKAARRIVLTR